MIRAWKRLIAARLRFLLPAILLGGIVGCLWVLRRALRDPAISFHLGAGSVSGIIASYTIGLVGSCLMARQLVLATVGIRPGYAQALLGQASLMIGKYVPGKVFGLLARATTLPSQANVRTSTVTVLLEQVIGLTGILVVSLLAISISNSSWTLAVLAGGVVMIAIFSAPGVGRISAALGLESRFAAELLVDLVARMRPITVAALMALAILAAAGILGVALFVPSMLGMTLPWRSCAGLVGAYGAAILIGMSAFFLPGGIGAREAAFVLLTSGQTSPIEATAIASVLRLVNVGADMLMGAIALAIVVRRKMPRVN